MKAIHLVTERAVAELLPPRHEVRAGVEVERVMAAVRLGEGDHLLLAPRGADVAQESQRRSRIERTTQQEQREARAPLCEGIARRAARRIERVARADERPRRIV